jgi:extracellular factor (EF) 3-hydroxypalmitic acid methyl ester biosynthesis protein
MKFLNQVHLFEKRIDSLKKEISADPNSWQKFQGEVNRIIDSVFELCWEYERQHADNEEQVYKLRRIFTGHFMDYFKLGSLSRMVVEKPFGYHGDFLIIDEIYKNSPTTTGVERCMDNYFLSTPASTATRNRKEDFKNYLTDVVLKAKSDVRIMDLASGPCRDLKEFLDGVNHAQVKIEVDCVDHDPNAIRYGQEVLKQTNGNSHVHFIQRNAMRIALTKTVDKFFPHLYDVVYSTGLFDYLDDRIAIPLISNLKKLLKAGGLLIISNYRDKWSNPSRHFMEWGGAWELVYRTEDDFKRIFKEAGFEESNLTLKYEHQKIMQYRFAAA